MTYSSSDAWRNKYEGQRTPEEYLQRFISGEVTLAEIGQTLGVSGETVRNDFKKMVGHEGYLKAVICKRRLFTEKVINRDRYKCVSDFFDSDSWSSDFRSAVKKIDSMCSDLTFIDVKRMKTPYFVVNKKSVAIRCGRVLPSMRDYRSGYLRFKVSSSILSFDFVSFFVFHDTEIHSYIFPPSDISSLKSLALRFKQPLRVGKYRNYLEKWEILNG